MRKGDRFPTLRASFQAFASEGFEPSPMPPSLFGEPPPRPARLSDVTLTLPSGAKMTWKLTHTRKAWEGACTHCGKAVFIGTGELRPGAVACGHCKKWVPTP